MNNNQNNNHFHNNNIFDDSLNQFSKNFYRPYIYYYLIFTNHFRNKIYEAYIFFDS